MRYAAIRLLMLGTCVMAVAVAATESAASSRHIRKHQHRMNLGRDSTRTLRDSWAAGNVRPIAPPRAGPACPGSARAIDCTVWPPPIDEDPDRKATSSDGG
jgi:hypothetical protein